VEGQEGSECGEGRQEAAAAASVALETDLAQLQVVPAALQRRPYLNQSSHSPYIVNPFKMNNINV
jgi:hypothetical protein